MIGKATSVGLFLALLSLAEISYAQSQDDPIQGRVMNDSTDLPIAGVFIRAEGSFKGVYTNENGVFQITTRKASPVTLIANNPQFMPAKRVLTDTGAIVISMVPEGRILPKSVSAPSRRTEPIDRTLISVDKMTHRDIQEAPAMNFYPAIGNLRGAYATTPGMLVQSVSPGGMTSGVNRRSIQLIDGVDTQIPGEGFYLGNFLGPPELDVEAIELVPINSSPIYGPNALNGVVSMTSKSPFDYTGLDAIGKVGLASVGSTSSPVYEFGLRYAYTYKKLIGIKVNFSQLKSDDWQGNSLQNVRPGSLPLSTRATDPGYNGANVYGDEIFSLLPFGVAGGDQVVTRTGYNEQDLGTYGINNNKFGAALHFRPWPALEAILQYQSSSGNSVFQDENRSILNDIQGDLLKLEIKGSHFFLRAYQTSVDVGNGYDMVLLGQSLNLFAKNNTEWFRDYSVNFQQPPFDQSTHREARNFADGIGLNQFGNNIPRLEPGTPQFEEVKTRLLNGEIPFIGSVQAQFESKSRLTHFGGYYDFSEWTSLINVQIGYMLRYHELDQESTLINDLFRIETFNQIGAYAQISKSALQEKLDVSLVLRFDDNNIYESRLSPRIAGRYTVDGNHHFRASYQQGFRDPSLQELFLVKPNGEGELRGGLNLLNVSNLQGNPNNAIPLVGFSIFESYVDSYSETVENQVAQGVPRSQAEQNNLQIIDDGILTNANRLNPLLQENNQTVELGYQTWLLDRLMADVSYFHNTLENAIGHTTVFRPFGTQPPGFDLAAAANLAVDPRTRQKITYYQNSAQKITSQGIMLGLKYTLPKNFWVGLNGTWLTFNQDQFDVVDIQFNAPEYKANLFLGNSDLLKNLGFQVMFRWQDSFMWKSPGNEGVIDSYGVLDGQVNYRIPWLKATVKLGGTNLLNDKYANLLGGAELGGLYYLSLAFNQLQVF